MQLPRQLAALWPASAASTSPSVLVLGGFIGLIALLVWVIRAVSSPLGRIPGPRLSLFTSAALRWHEMRGGRTAYVHAQHQRYGPVVRLSPNEVSFASAAAVKEIYGAAGSGYDKTEFYNLFTVYGRRTMFSTLNKERHARRRRILADRYANSNVMKPSSLGGIEERSRAFAQLCASAPDQTLDVYSATVPVLHIDSLAALHAYAFDCVTHHLFHPYGTNSLQDKADEEILREVTFDSSLQDRLIRFYSPRLHAAIGRVLALFLTPRSTPLADSFVLQTADQPEPAAFTLLSRMKEVQRKAAGEDDEEKSFDLLDAAAESLDHMAAGIDTTGDGLCFLMWELSQPRSLSFQKRLRHELRANATSPSPSPVALDRLPFLDAVIQEGLRCFPAIPMSLPRVVPGRAWGVARGSYFVPVGTVVSSQPYSVHRLDTAVFPDPDTFNPDRWLAEDGDADRKRLFFAFASGGRGCVGKHLAMAEMRTLLRDIYSRFATAPEASMTDESMSMDDQIISSRPLGQRCLLKFIPLNDVDTSE
ncbi:serine/threonine-protein kinase [Grosmannia clavigera kw1407]|uniref:Serine/threonine-protein kinase n=1 Tax=Grosmannia clavigera (strain kw1407 / UAMH 11150) TaxID=655863 RepID=F0XC55_GROCL|nr:serine/threonine-protein kinase [Grosmannia clavigera kw1407]EFX04406.1 serine/threonine-protein kinase [Grosmannia clavigera kw1407]